jgi:hypothetical protein
MLKTKFCRMLPVLASSIIAVLVVSRPATAQCVISSLTIGESSASAYSAACNTTTALQQTIARDPGPGGLSNVLAYSIFDSSMVGGDVLLVDTGTNTISDVLRFDPGSLLGPLLYFYSLAGPGLSAAADIGLPTAFNTNQITIQEGTIYVPTAGEPGLPGSGTVSYNFQSDTPEPSIVGLIVPGLGVVLLYRVMIGRKNQRCNE